MTEENCRAKALIYLAYFGTLKPGELAMLKLSSLWNISTSSEHLSIWMMTIPGRSVELANIYVLPPAQEAILTYLRLRGLSLNAVAKNADLSLLLSDGGGTNSLTDVAPARNGLSRIAKRIFDMAAERASSDDNLSAVLRLKEATLTWLANAFEAHLTEHDVRGNWQWHLLGARRLVPQSTYEYLPKRSDLSETKIVEGFQALQTMWKHSSASASEFKQNVQSQNPTQ